MYIRIVQLINIEVMKITKDQILKIDRAISRNIEIANGMRINHNNVFKSKKTYTRKLKHKQGF